MNKFLRALLRTGIHLLEQSDRVTTLKDRVEDLIDRTGRAIRGKQDHTVRNAVSFAAGIALGVGVGMLVAPASGEETRSSIAGKVQDMGDIVRERFSAERKKPATGTEGK